MTSTVCAAALRANARGVLPAGSPPPGGASLPARGNPVPLTETNNPGSGHDGQRWNWRVQNTEIVQGYPGIPAKYSGLNSLPHGGETRETVSLDLYAGVRLWPGAEAHIDGLMWQGFGLGDTLGVEGFPNGEAFKLGTDVPSGNIARLFLRQTIGFGGAQEDVDDDELNLAGKQDVSRLTLTLGRFSPKDIFDNNSYANDPRAQFMNWSLMANEAWDYPADALGFTTGFAAELNQPVWTLRYGFFQMPGAPNGLTGEDLYFKWPYDSSAQDGSFISSWGMVSEFERRYAISGHPGAVRLLAYLNHTDMGNYQQAINDSVRPADIAATGAYRYKYGFGLNWEQEIIKNVGVFSRLGWSDGNSEAGGFSDVDYTATAGISLQGGSWRRSDDTFGLAGVANGISPVHQEFFQAGGTGILAGDGELSYGWEKILETYYDA